MANSTLSALSVKTSVNTADLLLITDSEDTTQSPQGTSKSLTVGNLFSGISIAGTQITGTLPFSQITGTVPVAQGGTGAVTLTGILKGNGTSAVTAVTAPSGAIVGTTDTQALTNKTLTDATNSFPTSLVTLTGTQTLTNKRITKRVLSAASYTTDTGTSLNCDNLDWFIVTAQAGALKLNNPTGTPTDGQLLGVAVTGTAARSLTYDTQFVASTTALPTTTVTTARLNMLFCWSGATSQWIILAAV
jgi:hypothetical protein